MSYPGCVLVLLSALAAAIYSPVALSADAAESNTQRPLSRHSIDLGLSFLESRDFNSLTGLFSYRYNMTPNSNFTVTVPYVDSDFGEKGGSGIGDTELVYTWSPNLDITADPWVPKTAGSGLALVVPTGTAGDGRSLDTYILMPFLGLVIPVSEHLYVYPGFQAAVSTDRTVTGRDVRLGMGRVGLTWLGEYGFWASFDPVYIKDFEADATHLNLGVEAGKLFSTGFGFSVRYDDLEQFLPGAIPSEEDQYDQVVTVSLHFVF